MKLMEVRIDGFGIWIGLRLAELSPECTVFYGPNEAGKTTLLQFVRSVLYGFSPERTARYLPPLRGGPAGGALKIADGLAGDLIVRRETSESHSAGTVSMESADGVNQGDSVLARLLHDVDESTFNNIFAVGLRELQELATLADSDAARQLYELTSGVDRVSLCDVLNELQNSRGRILADAGRNCQIGTLLDERRRLQREVAELSSLSPRYDQLASERAKCDADIARGEEVLSQRQSQHRTLEAASIVYDTWQERGRLDAQIAALASNEAWPETALLRMDRLSAAIKKWRGRTRQVRQRRQKLASNFRAKTPNELLLRQSARIAALVENEAWIVSVEQELGAAETMVGSLAKEQENQQKELTTQAPFHLPASQPLDRRLWDVLRKPAGVVSKSRRRMKAVHRISGKQKALLDSRKSEIDSAMSSVGQQDLNAAVEAAGERVSQLRRRMQLDEQLKQLAQTTADLDLRIAELEKRQILPPWMLIGLGAAFVFGVMLLLAGVFLPVSFTGALAWPMVVLGFLGIGAAAGGKFTIERSLAGQLASAEKQLDQAQSQIERAEAERTELDQALPKTNGSLPARLQAAEQELAKLEKLLPLHAERQTAAQTANQLEQKLEEVRNRYQAALRHWRAALINAGLPDRLTPRQVRNMSVAGANLAGVASRLTDAQSDLDRRRRELAALSARIQQIFLSAAIQPECKAASQQLQQLRRLLSDEEAAEQRRNLLRRKAGQLRRKEAAIEQRLQRLKRRRRALLKRCNVADVAAFRRRAAEASRLAELTSQRDAAAREIASLLAGSTAESAIEEIVKAKTNQQLESCLRQVALQLEAARAGQQRLFEQRGQLQQQMLQLAGDRRLAASRFALGQAEERLSAAIQRWKVLTLTQKLMEQIKADYERNRQPETLREASGYLAQLTLGRYKRVWTPMSEPMLLIDDAQGRPLTVEALSCGTREQLFLSLRLALVALFTRRGAALPMILDDVLVNFDTDRASAAALVLRQFAAAGHQLLIFTCHEHIARLFKSHGMDVRRLPDNSRPGRDLPFGGDNNLQRSKFVEANHEIEPIEEAPAATTLQFVDSAASIEIGVQAAVPASSVDVQYTNHTILAADEPQEPVAPPQRPLKRRRPKMRIDPPQQFARLSTIRRRWAAEEFSGELDDRINPLWLMNGQAEAEHVQPAQHSGIENGDGAEPATILPIQTVQNRPQMFKLQQFDDEPAPLVIEVMGDDSAWDI